MITAQHIIADIRAIATSGGNSDDFKVSDEQILYWINEIRSMLISQALDKNADVADIWLQTIGCFEMELTDISSCCTVETGCLGLRSVLPVPTTIGDDMSIMSVYTIEGGVINELNKARARYSKYNKFTGKSIGWFVRDGHLYLVNDTMIEMVSIAGIWEDPTDLAAYATCDGNACWSVNSEYPVSLKMASQITDIVIKTKIQPMLGFPMDNSNNASGATPQQAQQSKQE